MNTIGEFELIDHGIEYSQYFQGCGIAFTLFDNVVTGSGDNPAEAIEDCLEQIAMSGWETEGMESRVLEQERLEELPTTPSVSEADSNCEDYDLPYYHVSIRWNEESAD